MARLKIDYGIDLGTTNSAICRMEKGAPTVKKIEVTDEIMPSCVYINKKRSLIVGGSAFSSMKSDKRRATKSWKKEESNTYIEFKRTMGTDTLYASSNMGKDFSSEELSAEVLKRLKSFITDENFASVVITVPAKFTVSQNTATMKAAKLAGFEHCELLQEPIAAAMAYGLSSEQKNGYWMVFDFGGGTFDAALLKVEDGIMQVFDTEGDTYLGGKNLDYAIVDDIIIPYLEENYSIEGILADDNKKEVLRDAMKTYAEEVKNQLSFKDSVDILTDLGELGEDEDGEEIELDLSVSKEEAFAAMRPHFQKAVDVCKELLKRNNMTGMQLDKLILVGGPTHSPLIRKMLKEQITPNVDTSIDPMIAVVTGATLYASTIDADASVTNDIEIGTIRLNIGYEATSVETVEWVSVKLDKKATGSNCPEKVWVELVRGDKGWSSGKVEIDEMGNVIEANLLEGKPNGFSIITYDAQGNSLDCFPNELTIIQGSKVGAAPLPYHIGIAVYDDRKEKTVFEPFVGLEKNKPLPAVGVINNRKTLKQIRPGVSTDMLRIPVYQADAYTEGAKASLYEYVADIAITGDDVESLIPEGSSVDVTLKVNSSQMMVMEIYFPAFGFIVEKELDTSKLQSIEEATKQIPNDICEAQYNIDDLTDAGIDTIELQEQLDRVKEEHRNSSEKKAVLQHLKEVLRQIEEKESSTEWPRLEKELREEFERLEKANDELGNEKSTAQVNQLRSQVDRVIRNKNVNLGYEIKDQVHSLFFLLTLPYQLIGWIRHHNSNFGQYHWKDINRASSLMNQAINMINNQPKTEELHPIVISLMELLPVEERKKPGTDLGGFTPRPE